MKNIDDKFDYISIKTNSLTGQPIATCVNYKDGKTTTEIRLLNNKKEAEKFEKEHTRK